MPLEIKPVALSTNKRFCRKLTAEPIQLYILGAMQIPTQCNATFEHVVDYMLGLAYIKIATCGWCRIMVYMATFKLRVYRNAQVRFILNHSHIATIQSQAKYPDELDVFADNIISKTDCKVEILRPCVTLSCDGNTLSITHSTKMLKAATDCFVQLDDVSRQSLAAAIRAHARFRRAIAYNGIQSILL